jgi:hypothetical protein
LNPQYGHLDGVLSNSPQNRHEFAFVLGCDRLNFSFKLSSIIKKEQLVLSENHCVAKPSTFVFIAQMKKHDVG